MSNPITLTRFNKDRVYTRENYDFTGCIDASDRCHCIFQYMQSCLSRMLDPKEPKGWSFAKWRSGTNVGSNFIEASAIMLEYPLTAWERLMPKMAEEGWTHFWISTQTKNSNTVTLVLPLRSTVGDKQYARIASIFAQKLDEYGMEEGTLAAHHIIHPYRTSVIERVDGHRGLIDPLHFIKMTERQYQRKDSLKYEGDRPANHGAAKVQVNAPVYTSDDAGLFVWAMTDKEKAEATEQDLLRR